MTQIQDINGNVIEVSDEKFERKLSMVGTYSSSPQQRRKAAAIGGRVHVAGVMGPALHVVYAVSTDGLTWRDETGTERHACDILL